MTSAREDVQRTLSLIETIKLPHPSGRLLSSFVTEAVDPALAARYVRDRLSAGDAHSTVSDWTYIVESSMYVPSSKPLHHSECSEFRKTVILRRHQMPSPDVPSSDEMGASAV